MRVLMLLPRLIVLTPPRPGARLARLCTTPTAQFDQSFAAQPPSEKQFEYAQSLALQVRYASTLCLPGSCGSADPCLFPA